MDEEAGAERAVALRGCHNFRDLGGHTTRDGRRLRRGRLFRSDTPQHMTPDDVRHVRDVLGVRTIVDLRSPSEVETEDPGPLAGEPFRLHHVSLGFDRENRPDTFPHDLGEYYFKQLSDGRHAIAQIVEILAGADEPAFFHCMAGKDRTGIISAVVLGALGVADEHIVRDYAFTNHNLEAILERVRNSASYRDTFDEFPPHALRAEPDSMRSLLRRVRLAFGSMLDFVRVAGVNRTTLVRLEATLVDDA
jgi:hypothetical protein